MSLPKYCLAGTCILFMGYGSIAAAKTVVIHVENSSPSQVEIGYEMMPPEAQGAHYFWQPVRDGQMPRHAFAGGRERDEILYICQSFYNGGVHPGKVVAGRCNITYGGAEIPRDRFRVLVGEGFDWRSPKRDRIPPNAVVGGFENGRPLYICHARYDFHGVHPGKIVAGACNIGYGGQEIRIPDYQVLVNY